MAQISPGELSKYHSDLEGISNCTKCHILGKGIAQSKCLNCHKPIRKSIEEKTGYHSQSKVLKEKCWKCHSEHHGKKFRIVNFNRNDFDHSITGFKLKSKHKQINCEDCHKNKFIKNVQIKNKKITFLGLTKNCIGCHEDVHQKTLNKDCSKCHNSESFKPAVYFNHDRSKFRLTGLHKKVDCGKCHKTTVRNGKKFQHFKNIRFSSCSSCHKDPHKGKFGKDCISCHITSSFKKINRRNFNHSKTDFPLLGKHKNVKCNDCHKDGKRNKLKFALCTDCHEDYHKGDFVKNNKQTDCTKCHTVDGFTPSNFGLEMHNKTKFRLTGSHLAVSCIDCHKKEKDWHFKNIGVNCIDCHKNIHGKEITNNFMVNNECRQCHGTESWDTISFNHNNTNFKLEGKHNNVSCSNCHKNKQKISDSKFIFASIKSECEFCHTDVHYGQFKMNGQTICQNCHSTYNDWSSENFDHEKTKFSLKDGHEKLPCSACHKHQVVNGNQYIIFKLEAFTCAACHS